jgi:O-antigen/teichoic acid export membrane protein
MSLKKRAVQGLFWTFMERFSFQGINFIISIVLARLLMPEEFGLIGMILVFINIGLVLRDSGLTTSLIRTQDPDEDDYSTVFLMNLAASIVIYIVLFLSAPAIADFFSKPELEEIVRVITLRIVISAFSSIQVTRLTKVMNFKRQMAIQIPALTISGIVGIGLAWYGYGVWSLVYMNLIQEILASVAYWLSSGWRPSMKFSAARFKSHFNFGYKLTLSGLIDTIYQNLYNILIGKYFSAAQLGFYTRAKTLRQLPVENISTALNKVTYPMFAEIQQDDVKLKDVYRRVMQQVIFWIAPILIGGAVLADPVIRFLFTEKWLPAVPFFQILCIGGIIYPLHAYNLNILKVKGRSDLFLRLEIIKKLMGVTVITVGLQFGIYGLLYSELALSFIAFFINTWYSGRLLDYPASRQALDITPILLVALAMGFFVWVVDGLMVQFPDIIRLLTGSLVGAVLYFGISYVLKSSPLIEFRQIVLKR